MNQMMECMLSRRSVRDYLPEPVREEELELIMRAAMSAPTAWNQKSWEFLVVDDRASLGALASVDSGFAPARKAAMAIIVVSGPAFCEHPEYWEVDSGAAVQNILLAAHSLGLGAVWCGAYHNEHRMAALRRIFPLPEGKHHMAVIAIGRPAEEPPRADRYDPSKVRRVKAARSSADRAAP
jgi:nitroreductase